MAGLPASELGPSQLFPAIRSARGRNASDGLGASI